MSISNEIDFEMATHVAYESMARELCLCDPLDPRQTILKEAMGIITNVHYEQGH